MDAFWNGKVEHLQISSTSVSNKVIFYLIDFISVEIWDNWKMYFYGSISTDLHIKRTPFY